MSKIQTKQITLVSPNGLVEKNLTLGNDGVLFVDAMYPIGSIYISVLPTNPSTYFGGTWVAFASGRTLVGIDAGQTEFDVVEETGGAKTHTLDITQIPSHEHNLILSSRGQYLTDGVGVEAGTAGVNPNTGNSAYPFKVQSMGGGLAHNNLQPYIVTYMFKRTA